MVLTNFKDGIGREELYDRLYSMDWGETTTNNYGFAPAEGEQPERFQIQLYTELLKLLNQHLDQRDMADALEISCGRGGGLSHLARHLPPSSKIVGLDSSRHAIEFCTRRYAATANLSFVHGLALNLPFDDGAFDVVISVEASHAYGDDAGFLREVRRVLRPGGRFLFADYRTQRKVPRLEELACAAGLAGELHDITLNVVSACELDAQRRRRIIRAGLPWYSRLLLASSLEGYSALPGTVNFERFRGGDRMYFVSCMAPTQQHVADASYQSRARSSLIPS
jgi:ubiquinone/menaquinone biosynthesis C-methylase UbiE